MPASYAVKNVYNGTSVVSAQALKEINESIKPKDIISMQGIPPTVGSYGHAEPVILVTPEGYACRTANKLYKFSDIGNGPVTEQGDYELVGMKKAGEDVKPTMFNIIPKMPNVGLIVSPRSRMHFTNPKDTLVDLATSTDIVHAIDPNKDGFYRSKIANFESLIKSSFWDDARKYKTEAVSWIDFLARKGYTIDKSGTPGVTAIGVEESPHDYFAGYYDRKGYLNVFGELHNRARRMISQYGLNDREAVEAMKRSVLFHEIGHVLGVKGDRKSEKLQGELQNEFYSEVAQLYKGTKLGSIYKALAREAEDYAKSFSLGRSILEEITADISPSRVTEPFDEMLAKFEAEAKVFGMKGKELIDYVEARAKNHYGTLLREKPSLASENSNTKNTNSNKRKSLEGIVNNEGVEVVAGENGEVYTTVDGKRVVGGDGAYTTDFIGSYKEYGGASRESVKGKISGEKIKSMNDAQAVASKGLQAESTEEPETAESQS